jgi:flagellar protein FliO/FliZ
MKLRSVILLLGLFILPAAAWADGEVIHPRAAAPAEAPIMKPATGADFPLLSVALACAVVGGWLFWRQRQGLGARGQRLERKLVIAETRPLGNRQHLVVADYDGRKFLLGVCPGRIDLLAPLDEAEEPGDS